MLIKTLSGRVEACLLGRLYVFTLVVCSVGGKTRELGRFVEVIAVNQWCGGTACCVRYINRNL